METKAVDQIVGEKGPVEALEESELATSFTEGTQLSVIIHHQY